MKKTFIKRLRNLKKNKIEKILLIILSIICIIFLFYLLRISSLSWESIITDTWQEVLITSLGIVGAACVAYLIHKIVLIIMNKIEDTMKLNPDYEELINTYSNSIGKFLKIKIGFEQIKLLKLSYKSCSYFQGDFCILPIEVIFFKSPNKKFVLEISDKRKKYYRIPTNILQHYDENIQAHESSCIYNNLLVKVDDCSVLPEGCGIFLKTSRTTYFDSLVTNRSVDYIWESGLTIRKMYTYGKRISSLRNSSLSNHLGINGIVKTKDGYIVCVHRNGEASIGKRTYSISVGAAVQSAVVVDGKGRFVEKGINNAIEDMLCKELNLQCKDYQFSVEDNIIGFYRDWVEGGKPQLLFYVDCLVTSEELRKLFESRKSKVNQKISFIHLSSLQTAVITADYVIVNPFDRKKKYYNVLPSVAASVYLFCTYLENKIITSDT